MCNSLISHTLCMLTSIHLQCCRILRWDHVQSWRNAALGFYNWHHYLANYVIWIFFSEGQEHNLQQLQMLENCLSVLFSQSSWVGTLLGVITKKDSPHITFFKLFSQMTNALWQIYVKCGEDCSQESKGLLQKIQNSLDRILFFL